MENYNLYSYLSASLVYLLLLPVFLSGVKKNPIAIPFFTAAFFSLIWSGFIAISSYKGALLTSDILPVETLRNIAWLFLLSSLMPRQSSVGNYSLLFLSQTAKLLTLLMVFIFLLDSLSILRLHIQQITGRDLRLFAHVISAVISLMLVEQIYRNAVTDVRYSIKYLCLGLGGLFIIDFIIYSEFLLFTKLDFPLWDARGIINALIAPLLVISFFRLQSQVIRITISRKIVLYTTVLFCSGLYLILMFIAGFYIRAYGGNWGGIAQILVIFMAILLLSILFISGKTRAIAKFYVGKHFFQYRYDYRDEWIKLSKTISQLDSINELSSFIINTMADLVDSSGGGIWLKNEQGHYYLAEEKNLGFTAPHLVAADDSLIKFFNGKKWVVDFVEFFNDPEVYDGVDLSAWYGEEKNVWLIIPLFRQNDMEAFVVLTQARISRRLNWEDHDLLKTVGMQLTNALALSHVSDALSRSRQFEAYNRLSAYLVHDLKNLVAQIALIVKNAEKHKSNPEFIDDSILTLENVVTKIEYLLSQLKKGNITTENKAVINLLEIITDISIQQAGNKPVLHVSACPGQLKVFGEREKITAILGHLIQNAQEATDDSGYVRLEFSRDGQHAVIKVKDNGSGMDEKFIAERLFKPFDTTKGNAGMGIGVYEARDYIVRYSGEIVVDSKPGQGTTFTIRFPLVK